MKPSVDNNCEQSNTGSSLILGVFLVINALKTALLYLPFESAAGYDTVVIHFLPAFFLSCAVFTFLLQCRSRLPFLIVYLLQIAYLEINLCYFYYFNELFHLNYLRELLREGFDVIKSFSFTGTSLMNIVFIDILPFLYLFGRFRSTELLIRRSRVFAAMPIFGMILFLGGHSLLYLTGKASYNDFTVNISARDWRIIKRHGFMANNIVDLMSDSNSEVAFSKIAYGKEYTDPHGRLTKSNIVMIQFESLDANIINYKYSGEYVAPFLHKLSGESIYYPYTLCYRKVGGSSDCEISVINSIEPLERTVTMNSDSYLYPNAITKRMPASYSIKAFHGNNREFYGRDAAYLKMGFSEFCDINSMKLAEEGWGASDHNVLEYVEKRLASEKEPFFYYIITMSCHEPFRNVLNYYHNDRFRNIGHEPTRNYFTSIAYSDAELQRFVGYLRSHFPNTYIFIYGDHTPFLDNRSSYERSIPRFAEKKMEFVPLFIITPDQEKYVEHKRVATYLDLAPTILSASGVSGMIRTFGEDLLNTSMAHNPVNFRGGTYDRSLLFNTISRHNPVRSNRPESNRSLSP